VRLPAWTAEDAEARSRAAARGVRPVRLLVEPDRHGLLALTDLVGAGRLRVEIDSVYALADAVAAHRRIETGRVTGKVVLDVAGSQEGELLGLG
jgi:NADPH:quinone reductase-like Zn-dependent oxidoreductase